MIYEKFKNCEVYNADCFHAMADFINSGRKFDGLLTDPPYNSGGRSYEATRNTGNKYFTSDLNKSLGAIKCDSMDPVSAFFWNVEWLKLANECLGEGSPILIFCDWRRIGDMIRAAAYANFIHYGIVVWDKNNSRPQRGRFRNQCEYIYFGAKGKIKDNIPAGCLPGVYKYQVLNAYNRKNAFQKPEKLIIDLLKIFRPESRILDPFAGCGTTIAAGISSGLKVTAVEIDKNQYAHCIDLANQLNQ